MDYRHPVYRGLGENPPIGMGDVQSKSITDPSDGPTLTKGDLAEVLKLVTELEHCGYTANTQFHSSSFTVWIAKPTHRKRGKIKATQALVAGYHFGRLLFGSRPPDIGIRGSRRSLCFEVEA
jgi:hypothetical protein